MKSTDPEAESCGDTGNGFCISGRAAGGKEWFGEIIKIQGNYSADSIGNTGKKEDGSHRN